MAMTAAWGLAVPDRLWGADFTGWFTVLAARVVPSPPFHPKRRRPGSPAGHAPDRQAPPVLRPVSPADSLVVRVISRERDLGRNSGTFDTAAAGCPGAAVPGTLLSPDRPDVQRALDDHRPHDHEAAGSSVRTAPGDPDFPGPLDGGELSSGPCCSHTSTPGVRKACLTATYVSAREN